jgi:hypothetical protein
MPILIRDEHFEAKIDGERKRRRQKVSSKTLIQLAEERMVELQTGQFLPPVEMPPADGQREPATSGSA